MANDGRLPDAAELREGGRLKDIGAFIDGLYGGELHAKRVASLAAATLGVMPSAARLRAVPPLRSLMTHTDPPNSPIW